MKISRIRLSDKTSRLHPRHVVPKPAQAHEPEVPVKVREGVRPALASPDLVLEAQPPAQPHSGVVVERPVRFCDGAYFEVVRPSAQRTVQLLHQPCGLLPGSRSDGQITFRHFCSGSLALASLNHTCRNLVPTFPQRSPPSLLTKAAC